MLCVSGMPYDTLHSVIGLTGENMGSLKDYGIAFDCVPLKRNIWTMKPLPKRWTIR